MTSRCKLRMPLSSILLVWFFIIAGCDAGHLEDELVVQDDRSGASFCDRFDGEIVGIRTYLGRYVRAHDNGWDIIHDGDYGTNGVQRYHWRVVCDPVVAGGERLARFQSVYTDDWMLSTYDQANWTLVQDPDGTGREARFRVRPHETWWTMESVSSSRRVYALPADENPPYHLRQESPSSPVDNERTWFGIGTCAPQ